MARVLVAAVFLLLVPLGATAASDADPPRISEVVADPQWDWSGDGKITGSDEWVELENPSPHDVDLSGWRLLLNDSTPATHALPGTLRGGARLVVWNPSGDLNNNGHVALIDPQGRLVHEVRFGTWPGAAAPTADAGGDLDESLRRRDGSWARGVATPLEPNEGTGWRLRDTWTRSGPWTPPAEDASIQAVLLDEDATWAVLRYVEDRGGDVRAVSEWHPAGPAQRLAASRIRSSGNESFTYWWEAANGNVTIRSDPTRVDVDATPPRTPPIPAVLWTTPRGSEHPIMVADEGVGGAEWMAEMEPQGSTAWSRNESLVIPNGTRGVRLLVRDAFGNEASWNTTVPVRLDDVPPAAPSNLWVSGDGPFELHWALPLDPESGLARIDVRRNHTQNLFAVLEANATQWRDEFRPAAGRLAYEVRGVDRAGNEGRWAEILVDHPGYRANVVGVRVSRTVWSSGGLEVRVDYDRRMSMPPSVDIDGTSFPPDEARFLANASTYWMRWSDPGPLADGSHVIRIQGARAQDGAPQAGSATARIHVDQAPPRLRSDLEEGRTNASFVRIRAEDVSGAALSWRLVDGAGDEAARGASQDGSARIEFPAPGRFRVLAKAVDPHGHRASEEWSFDYRPDPAPCAAPEGAVDVAPVIATAAGAAALCRPSSPARPPTDPANAPADSIEDPARFGARLLEALPEAPAAEGPRGGLIGAAGASVGVAGIAATLGVRRLRNRRGARSFAERIRRARAEAA